MGTVLNGCCDVCGIPLDAEYFDVSGFIGGEDLPPPGERALLAGFEIHPQYCGALQCFVQFTDEFAFDNSRVHTPGLEWVLLRNGQPIFPYHELESLVNPWGYANYTFLIRLDEASRVEFVLRNRSWDFTRTDRRIEQVGGRIMGRFWYNRAYGAEAEPLPGIATGPLGLLQSSS